MPRSTASQLALDIKGLPAGAAIVPMRPMVEPSMLSMLDRWAAAVALQGWRGECSRLARSRLVGYLAWRAVA